METLGVEFFGDDPPPPPFAAEFKRCRMLEYMEDAQRRQQTKLQTVYQVEEQKHTTKTERRQVYLRQLVRKRVC